MPAGPGEARRDRGQIQGPYPILDADWIAANRPDLLAGEGPEALARRLARFASVVQLRCKGSGGAQYAFMARWMTALRAEAPRVTVIVNDRVDLALALEADGVHVGQDDLPVAACRELLGPDRLIGLSTHTTEEALAGSASGADYLGFGPVYPARSKADALTVRPAGALEAACRAAALPVVAIGGITAARCQEVAAAGAAGAAMISGLFDAAGDQDRLAEAAAAWKRGLLRMEQ